MVQHQQYSKLEQERTTCQAHEEARVAYRCRRHVQRGRDESNPETGVISAAFHVVIDDWFATVPSDPSDLPDFNSDEWSKMFGDSVFQYRFDDEDDENQAANDIPDLTRRS